MDWLKKFPTSITNKYELHNINHAAEILSEAYAEEFKDLIFALENFSLEVSDLLENGGNESNVPKKISKFLRPKEWKEVQITGDLLVKIHKRNPSIETQMVIEDFIGGHNIDYVKNDVAIDMEWNSKDQTYDRDLFAFRTFYEYGLIKCGVIITRSENLNSIFKRLKIMTKYGASTTWMGKLLPRIRSGRHGGCPLLIVGITSACVIDLEV